MNPLFKYLDITEQVQSYWWDQEIEKNTENQKNDSKIIQHKNFI